MANCQKCHLEVKPGNDCFTLNTCKHIYCHACIYNHVTANILQSNCKIKCPTNSCQAFISDQIIRKCLSNDGTNVYDQLSISASLSNINTNLQAVKCLTKKCPKMMLVQGTNLNFHCNYCDQPNCLKCKKRHFPSDCGKLNSDERTIDERAENALKKHAREELQNQFKNEEFIPNSDGFECIICCSFILPRAGVITRNCHHPFCKNCFITTIGGISYIDKMKCPSCSMDLNDQDIICAITIGKYLSMGFEKAVPKFFACKYPNCSGMWDASKYKGSYTCTVCHHINCLNCEDYHEGITCETYRQSSLHKEIQANKKNYSGKACVKCACGRLLIQKGGCGALCCNGCGNQVCLFTGKKAGLPGPDGCGCTTQKTCHKDCKFGCFPE